MIAFILENNICKLQIVDKGRDMGKNYPKCEDLIKMAEESEKNGDIKSAIKYYDEAKELAEISFDDKAFKKCDDKLYECLKKRDNDKEREM